MDDELHRQARRRKVELRSARASRVTWDVVMSEGLTLLLGQQGGDVASDDEGKPSDQASARRRLVQANLVDELEQGLVAMHLDLADRPGRAVTYEQLWATAIRLWLDSTA